MADETPTPPQASRTCPDCGHACAPTQRRCTNCGAAVGRRRPLPRRTPLIAALIVAAVGGGAVVVAQAEVTDRASAVASTTPDPASAPIPVLPPPLPEAARQTSTKPKPPPVEQDPGNPLEIPALDAPVVQQAQDERATDSGGDGANVPTDTKADPNDLKDEKRIKVRRAFNFDPKQRVGAEFGKPKAAIDKRSRTVWDVSVPGDGEPFGVGIVLDLGETHRVAQLRISTPTPGFGAVVYHADAEDRPEQLDDTWNRAKKIPSVRDELEVPLADEPVWARYILVLLTTPRSDADTRVAIGNLEVLP